jgi:hypothetical protein
MLVFIDESGDPGFKVARGSSPVFVAAMVMFNGREQATDAEKAVREALRALNVSPEFKFNKCSHDTRDQFFLAIRRCIFHVRAIVVRKEIIYSKHLRTQKESFYNYFVRQMLTYDGGAIQDAKVVIDGSGDREFRQALNAYLKRYLGSKLRGIRFGQSYRDPLLQLADMCAGAIARSYRGDRKHGSRWRAMLEPQYLRDVWEFK